SPSTSTSPPATHPLSLHDALPISGFRHASRDRLVVDVAQPLQCAERAADRSAGKPASRQMTLDLGCAPIPLRQISDRFRNWIGLDRKSTRLNSSHDQISYAVFCLK